MTSRRLRDRTGRYWVLNVAAAVGLCSLFSAVAASFAAELRQVKRSATVKDAIAMVESADWLEGREIGHYSPDGRKVVVIVRQGDLANNTNVFSLLLWETSKLRMSPQPTILLKMASSSNRDAIEHCVWMKDSETLVFLGEHPGELHQIYTFNIHTRKLVRSTSVSANILSFGIDASGGKLAFLAEQSPVDIQKNKDAERHGLVVTTQPLVPLLLGRDDPEYHRQLQLFTMRAGQVHAIRTIGKIGDRFDSPEVSPNGRYVIIATRVASFPAEWEEYSDPFIRRAVHGGHLASGQSSWLKQFELVDLVAGHSRILVNAPQTWGYAVRWLPDSLSAIFSGVYLPLEGTAGEDRRNKQRSDFAVEVKIPSGAIVMVGPSNLRLLRTFSSGALFEIHNRLQSWKRGAKVTFEKVGQTWKQQESSASSQHALPELSIEQSMISPPKIVASIPDVDKTVELLDLNPQLQAINLAKEEVVNWKGTDGHQVTGGLYFPVDYVAGNAYPLVIQTHWFTSDLFWFDGPWPTAYAAQPLAAAGIMVLQADENFSDSDTLEEVRREVSTFEGAIEYLGQRGLIDKTRVGIIGFSRTCLFVKYALTHSKYHFAAASTTDGVDGGYFQYIANSNSCVDCTNGYEGINGGMPFGEGLSSWLARSPSFSLDKVMTPVLLTALNPSSLVGEWEWLSGLRRLGKPVELIYIRDGSHELQRPWERMISQQGNVDWFRFWLQGSEEDSDPAKAEQYRRWEKLCDMEKSANPEKPGFCVGTKH